MKYCEDCEGGAKEREKRFHLKGFAIKMSTLSKFQRDTITTYTGKLVEEMRMMIVITER